MEYLFFGGNSIAVVKHPGREEAFNSCWQTWWHLLYLVTSLFLGVASSFGKKVVEILRQIRDFSLIVSKVQQVNFAAHHVLIHSLLL